MNYRLEIQLFNKCLQSCDHFWTGPFRRPQKSCHFRAFRVHDHGQRKPACLQLNDSFRSIVNINSEICNVRIFEERRRCLGSAPVRAQGQDGEGCSADFCLQRVESRHLDLARRAPRRPDVQQDRFSTPFRQAMRSPILVLKRDIGHRHWGRMYHELCLPCCNGLEFLLCFKA